MLYEMYLSIDRDLKNVLDFMQATISAAKLASVAHGIADISPALWGRLQATPLGLATLVSNPPAVRKPKGAKQ